MTVVAGGQITRQNYVDEINNRMKARADNKRNTSAQNVTDFNNEPGAQFTGATNALFPNVLLTELSLGNVDGSSLADVLREFAKVFSRVRRVRYSTSSCGSSYFRYVRINIVGGVGPDASFTGVPINLTTGIEGGDDKISASTFISIVTNIINQVQVPHFEKLYGTVTLCHCSCHSSCHSSRGRR